MAFGERGREGGAEWGSRQSGRLKKGARVFWAGTSEDLGLFKFL